MKMRKSRTVAREKKENGMKEKREETEEGKNTTEKQGSVKED